MLSSLFVGGLPYLLNWYKLVISILNPIFEKTLCIFGGSGNVILPVLFMEKLFKVLFASFVCSVFLLGLQKAFQGDMFLNFSRRKICFLLLSVGCAVSLCLLLLDGTYIRMLAVEVMKYPSISIIVNCQLGRFGLLIGSTLFMQNFTYLPFIHIFYIVFVYIFGVYYLAFSVTTNLFP